MKPTVCCWNLHFCVENFEQGASKFHEITSFQRCLWHHYTTMIVRNQVDLWNLKEISQILRRRCGDGCCVFGAQNPHLRQSARGLKSSQRKSFKFAGRIWGVQRRKTQKKSIGNQSSRYSFLERITGLEPATFALARRRSTKWAKSAFCGASGRNRTNDTGIFSPLLYQLSYRGICLPFIWGLTVLNKSKGFVPNSFLLRKN